MKLPSLPALLAALAAAASAAAISQLQPELASHLHHVKPTDEISALPPPRELRALAVGYRAAAADVLWASLVVEHGTRSQEKRPFNTINRYIDGIIALDPKHPTLYRFVDSLVVFKPVGVGTADDARAARAYLERGTREFPYDHELWLHYGQYIAFLGPSFLKDPAEIDAWRRDGAFAIARAVELGANADRTLTVSSLLGKAGEKKAQIDQLQRAYALTDNADTRHQIAMKLESLQATVTAENTVGAVEDEWRARYPFFSRGGTLLLGPYRDAAACAGPESRTDPRCPSAWGDR